MNNNIPEPNTNQGSTMQPQNNLNITQSINPQQEALNNLNSEQPINQPPLPPMPPKKSKGPLVIIILLILIILGLAGYICYDKFIAKDNKCDVEKTTKKDSEKTSTDTSSKKVLVDEYISIDGKEYLKLNDDNTYELKYAIFNKYKTNSGKYTKEETGYKLDGKISVLVEKDFIEIVGLVSDVESHKQSNILFNKNNVENMRNNIENSVSEYIKSEDVSQYPSALPIEKVTIDDSVDCFRYVSSENEINHNVIYCGIPYNIYVRGYNQKECDKETNDGLSEPEKEKYMPYMIPAATCQKDSIGKALYFELDQNNNYKTLSTASGL